MRAKCLLGLGYKSTDIEFNIFYEQPWVLLSSSANGVLGTYVELEYNRTFSFKLHLTLLLNTLAVHGKRETTPLQKAMTDGQPGLIQYESLR